MQISHLYKEVYGRTLISDLSWDMHNNNIHWIKGGPSSGKTLLCNMLCSIETPDRGEIRMPNQTMGRKMGVIFDVPALISNLSIGQNLHLVLDQFQLLHGKSAEESRKSVLALLAPWKLEQVIDLRPVALSRTQSLKISFIRALVALPEYLLWDDAFCDWDEFDQEICWELLSRELKRGMKLLCFSRNAPPAFLIDARVVTLREGRIVS